MERVRWTVASKGALAAATGRGCPTSTAPFLMKAGEMLQLLGL